MSFPTKAERETCWGARDRYWDCLDKHNVGSTDKSPEICNEFYKEFEKMCPAQWVKHFNRKRDYNIFKKQLEKNQSSSPM